MSLFFRLDLLVVYLSVNSSIFHMFYIYIASHMNNISLLQLQFPLCFSLPTTLYICFYT